MFQEIDFYSLSPIIKYGILFVLAIVEGPMIMLFAGFLLKLGVLSFVPTFASLAVGDLIGDVAWYGLGYLGGMKTIKKLGKFFSVTEAMIEKLETVLLKYHGRIIFFSKMTNGLGFGLATLIAAGVARIPLLRFMVYNFWGEFFWLGFLLFVGHSLGQLYLLLGEGLNYMSAIAGFITAAILLFGFANYTRKYFSKNKF